MIYYVIKGYDMPYEAQTIIQVFYPNRKYKQLDKASPDGITVEHELWAGISRASLYVDGKLAASKEIGFDSDCGQLRYKKLIIKKTIYLLLKEYLGYKPRWGLLTGIRPAKNISEFISEGLSAEEAINRLCLDYDADRDKAELAAEVALSEGRLLSGINPRGVGLYIGIPFCPTRCLYCSFTAYPIDAYRGRVDDYLSALSRELEFFSEHIKGRELNSIYIGGGTPTSLSADELRRLLGDISRLFNISEAIEFTAEAGRPDTITAEKLRALKEGGVSRISVNPQSLNQKTLDKIGRRHSVEDTYRAYYEARNQGFDNINMDIILGLPDETTDDVDATLEGLAKMGPDGLTVHTLAVKRASRLKETYDLSLLPEAGEIEKMISASGYAAQAMGMRPYYMYRQKNMLGSFENVGYCLHGKECLYNVEIMEESNSILAAGAGASTKTVNLDNGRIERIFNVKNIDDYISRIDEMIERKRAGL